MQSGYPWCVYEYTNDLACRDILEDAKESAETASVWPRVLAADERLRARLIPTKRSIHGEAPMTRFWWWGYPADSPELEDDLRSLSAI